MRNEQEVTLGRWFQVTLQRAHSRLNGEPSQVSLEGKLTLCLPLVSWWFSLVTVTQISTHLATDSTPLPVSCLTRPWALGKPVGEEELL